MIVMMMAITPSLNASNRPFPIAPSTSCLLSPHLNITLRGDEFCFGTQENRADAGFKFEFPVWPQAAHDLVGRWRHHVGLIPMSRS
jgi:hypothetical protein